MKTFSFVSVFWLMPLLKPCSGCQSLQLPGMAPLSDLSLLPDLLNELPPLQAPPIQSEEERAASMARNAQENEQFLQRASEKLPTPDPTIESCEEDYRSIVIAVSTAPYTPATVAVNLAIQRRSLRLLEAFTGKKISRFGPYTEESINLDGQYAYKLVFDNVEDCAEAKEFTTKAVSYSKHVEKALFKCQCMNLAISKLH